MIVTNHDGAVATIALDRPAARNAVSLDAWPRLAQAVASLPDSTRAVLLISANDGAFSAGADIGEFAALRGDAGARVAFRTAMRDAIEAIAAARVPTIAAIDGACFGAAVALALACDIRVAGDAASFATTPAKLGISYPAEDVARLIAQVGRGQASRLLFTAEAISADEAHRIGLAELRAAHAATHAHDLARRIAAHPPAAVRALKQVVADPADPGHAAAFDAAFGSDDFAQALAAFTSRRTPA